MNHSLASRIRIIRRHCLLALPAALAFNALAGTPAIPPAEKLLPDDTLVMVAMPDFAKVRDLYKTSPQLQLWNDPAMKPFKDKFLAKLREELFQPLERDLGVSVDDYANLPQGQLTVAMTQNGSTAADQQPAGLLLLLDAKDKSGQLKTNLATLRKKWVDAGKALKTEKIRDIEFSVFPMSGTDVPASLKKLLPGTADAEAGSGDTETNKAPKTELVIGQFESLLIVGNSLKPVEKVAVHLTGGSMPALGDLASYEANRLALFRDAPLYGWVNVKGLMDVLVHRSASKGADEEDPFAMFSPEKLLAAAGFNGVKSFAFNIRISNEGTLAQFFLGVPDASRQGLFKLYPGEPKESAPPPFVPADAVKFQRWRLDGQKAWATLEKVLSDISPQILTSLNFLLDQATIAAKEKDPGFDVKKSFVGNLGDDLITYEKNPRGPTTAEMDAPPSLTLIGSPHPDQLAAAMRSILVLLSQQGGAPTEREFLGRKIYSLPTPTLPLPTANPTGKRGTLSYAAGGSYLAFSTDAAMLEEYLRSADGPQKSLRDTPGLLDATAKLGGSSTGFFGYENRVETARVWFESLKNHPTETNANAAPGIPAWNPESGFGFKDWADYSLLPPFERISKYFYFSVYVGSASVDGLTFKLYSPAPPSLKK
jgi:hypothetical protein